MAMCSAERFTPSPALTFPHRGLEEGNSSISTLFSRLMKWLCMGLCIMCKQLRNWLAAKSDISTDQASLIKEMGKDLR